ncbi:unnamed protein product [Cylindrotheca closterium]|uniref:Uncharacterized protein n=1 Tax=Cylindrotheca closterium TaxID=2856 RepID=A0AAD2FKU1_9STRA|nr:unnamed protein product [Cylindrotheca closterium]
MIDWLPDNRPTSLFIRPFLDCVYELLTNQDVTGPNGENISLPHPTNPFKFRPDPQDEPDFVSEMHHGTWWRDTMEMKCDEGKREMLVPIILYGDEITTDKQGKLTACPFNLTLGILDTDTRNKEQAHTTFFYYPDPTVELAHHKKKATAHDKMVNLQNSLAVALADITKWTNSDQGLRWKLKYNGEEFQVNMKFSVAFLIGDTDMHDKLCGKTGGSQTHGMKSHCRHCNCATKDLVSPKEKHTWILFDPSKVDPTLDGHTAEYFSSISHSIVNNAFDPICFGQAGNKPNAGEEEQGADTDDADPSLAAKAKFKRWVKKTLESLDIIGHQYGACLGRQSERKKPRTKFNNSLFDKTKKCGHEQAGVCLCLYLAMISDQGRFIMLLERTMYPTFYKDQVGAFELVLTMEQWLKKKKYLARHALNPEGLGKVFDYYTDWIRETTFQKGMGALLIKNHLMLHVPLYMLHWGPPRGWDSGPSEWAHKTEQKQPAQRTQRRQHSFVKQLTARYSKMRLIALAARFFMRSPQRMNLDWNQEPLKDGGVAPGGARFPLGFSETGPGMKWLDGSKTKANYLQEVINLVCEKLLPLADSDKIKGFSEVKKAIDSEPICFRAHPNYRSKSRQVTDTWHD